jgi:Tfp pilus assembly protein PilW
MKKTQFGFSIVELMVSMVIFMIVIGSVYGLLQIGLIDRNRASRRSDILKNARAALHIIGRDALNAGLSYNRNGAIVPDNFVALKLGTAPDGDADRDILPAVYGGNNLFANLLNRNPAVRTDLVSFAYRDTSFNGSNVISLTNAAAAPSAPATVRLQTQPNSAQNVAASDLYLIESDSSQVAVMATGRPSASAIDVAPTDPLGLNQPLDGVGTNVSLLRTCTSVVTENCTTYVASVKRLVWVAYKVRGDGTFVRILFGNNGGSPTQIQELPIAYNVEDFQVKYVLEDGSVHDDPTVGPDGISGTSDDIPSNFNLVRQINVQIRVQGSENDEQLGTPQTITLSANFSTRNLEYDAG